MKGFSALLALASAVNAHMIMKSPVPAGNPNSSPLDPSGSDYPCKMGSGTLDTSKPNVMSVGSSNTLSFTGGATHGGGSCQVSLAKGTEISKNMKWMVIHSIEGGCPFGGDGNLSGDPNDSGASTFQFSVPDHPDLGPGDYTLAWTWNNRIGNREFYMNCAYVQLQGPQKKRYAPSAPAVSKRQQAPLPAMFVANIGNGCTVAEGGDVQYPDPGSSLEQGSGFRPIQPQGNCGASGVADPPAGNPALPDVPSAVSSIASPSSTGFSGPGNDGQYTQTEPNNFATVEPTGAATSAPVATQSSPAASQVTSAPVVVPSAPATSASAPAPIATGTAPVSPPSTGDQSGSCGNEGDWYCASNGKSFQRCASGRWSESIAMSAGLDCVPGISANFAYNVSGSSPAKRDIRSHIARRRLHGSIHS